MKKLIAVLDKRTVISPHISFLRTHKYKYKRRMSLSSLPPHIHSTSPPLHDDEMRQVEEYLADTHAIEEADRVRLLSYIESEAVAGLSSSLRLLTVPEDSEEELDTHSCGDSECQGEHVHATDDDYVCGHAECGDYECGHRSPVNYEYDMYGCINSEPYIPATPEFD